MYTHHQRCVNSFRKMGLSRESPTVQTPGGGWKAVGPPTLTPETEATHFFLRHPPIPSTLIMRGSPRAT